MSTYTFDDWRLRSLLETGILCTSEWMSKLVLCKAMFGSHVMS